MVMSLMNYLFFAQVISKHVPEKNDLSFVGRNDADVGLLDAFSQQLFDVVDNLVTKKCH